MSLAQEIRFCTTADGVRIAYAKIGDGSALVCAPQWLTHLEEEVRSPAWSHWVTGLSRGRTLVRYDKRGCGLSDRAVREQSVDAWVRDLEAVVEAAGLDTFPLFGSCQGGPIAVEYAARHPERVSHLVLYGTFARGRMKRAAGRQHEEEGRMWLKMVELGWGQDNPAYRQVFATRFIPEGSLEQLRSFAAMDRASTSPSTAVQLLDAFAWIDVSASAGRVRCPTLVLHAHQDAIVPFEEGRLLAGLIPGARLVTLESRNHVLLEHEPAWQQLLERLDGFLKAPRPSQASRAFPAGTLTAREKDVLELIAEGLGNEAIAARLGVSEKTVRNHITSVFGKLQVTTRAQAIVRARDAGFGLRGARTAN